MLKLIWSYRTWMVQYHTTTIVSLLAVSLAFLCAWEGWYQVADRRFDEYQRRKEMQERGYVIKDLDRARHQKIRDRLEVRYKNSPVEGITALSGTLLEICSIIGIRSDGSKNSIPLRTTTWERFNLVLITLGSALLTNLSFVAAAFFCRFSFRDFSYRNKWA